MPFSIATIRQIRRAIIALLAVATTVLAVILVVHALSPRGLGLAPTSQLMAILALLTLPACTVAAWAWDRSVRLRTAAWLLERRTDDHEPAESDTQADTPYTAEPRIEAGPTPPRVHPAGRSRPHDAPAAAELEPDAGRLSR